MNSTPENRIIFPWFLQDFTPFCKELVNTVQFRTRDYLSEHWSVLVYAYIHESWIGSIAKFWSSGILSLSDICTMLFRKFWNRISFARNCHHRQYFVQLIGAQTCLINVPMTQEAQVVLQVLPFFHIDVILWQDSILIFFHRYTYELMAINQTVDTR